MRLQLKRPQTAQRLTTILAIAFFTLSAVVLLISSGLQIFSNLQTQQAAMSTAEQLRAQDATRTVSSFVQEKFSVLETAIKLIDPVTTSPAAQKQILESLLGLQPAFRQLILLNAQDQDLAQASRLTQEVSEQFVSQLTDDLLAQSRQGQRYISSIYIDKVTSEPLVIMTMPVTNALGDFQGTLAAEVNLKFMWDLVDKLKVGETGQAYVVDRQGNLIAFWDITRVLRGENLSYLQVVSQFIQNRTSDSKTEVTPYPGITGDLIVGTYVPLGTPDWAVVTELPWQEAYQQVIWQAGLSIVITLVMAVLAGLLGLFMARRLAVPLVKLMETVTRITGGELELQAAVSGPKEVASLATAFNSMTAQLRDLIDGLEDRVFERTRALKASAEISHQVITLLNIDELLQYVVSFIQKEFNFYHAHIYLVDAETGDLVMTEGSGEVGLQLKEKGHRLPAGQGIVGTVAALNEHFLSNNVNEVLNFVRNPLLPNTNSELAVPLRKGEQVLGVLDIQSEEVNRFTSEDISLMQTIANETAVAISNARLLTETQTTLQEIERLNRQLTHEAWQQFGEEITTSGYRFVAGSRKKVSPASDAWLTPMKQAALEKQLVKQTHPGNGDPAKAELAVPLMLRGEVIGVLGVKREETPNWAEEEVAAVEAVANQIALALENARLSKEQEKTIGQLKDIDRLKSEFLTSMSHELRTPLNSIIGFADVLLQGIDGELNDMALNDVQLIHNSGKHLLALINDILDLSKIEAGKMELVREAVDIKDVANAVLASSHSLVKDKPVEIVTDVSDMLPPVYADKLRLNQILLNLVSNAAKFTHEGTITIKASLNPRKLDMMTISVIDTGIGIPASKLSSIFERFRQADSSTTRKYGGTGLGLAICRQLVEMHGGTLNVRSEEGVGSEFYFAIPLA